MVTIADKILNWFNSLHEILTQCNMRITNRSGTSATDLAGLPAAIDSIPSGGGSNTSDATASASDILSGKTAYISLGKATGSMTNRGAVALTMDGANVDSVTVPKGYHNGNGTVSLDSTISTKVGAQKTLIEEISAILDTKANAYPTITFDEATGILTITEVGS